MQVDLYANPGNICHWLKKIHTIYGNLPPKDIAGLKMWKTVHVGLIGLYSKSTIQQDPGGTIINNNVILVCMAMIEPVTGWFKMVEVSTYGVIEVTGSNDEYIDKSYTR